MARSKKIFLLFAITLFCAGFVFFDNENMFFGKTVNGFFPCVQNIADSAPCYGIYDIWAMLVAAVIGAFSFLTALYYLVRNGNK